MCQDKKDYIFPNIFRLRSLNDIEEIKTLGPLSFDESIRITSFYDVLSLNNELVLAEPGFGKTELLKHLNAYANDKNFSSLYVELRGYVKESNLENFIIEEASISSQPFSIVNNENVVLFLDAFDEAKHDSFSDLIRQIKVFHKQYPMEEAEQFIEAMFGKLIDEHYQCSKRPRYHDPDIEWKANSIKVP